jgi:hypothetical protein
MSPRAAFTVVYCAGFGRVTTNAASTPTARTTPSNQIQRFAMSFIMLFLPRPMN